MDDGLTERWLPIPGYEGQYEVSDKLRVRRLSRIADHGIGDGHTRALAPRLLATSNNNGYIVAYLCKPGNRKAKKFYVEAAAARLFPMDDLDLVDQATGEEWRNIDGYEGYQVSSFGRVRSLDRFINADSPNAAQRWSRGIMMTIGQESNGYPKVELSYKGKVKTISIHRLVAMTFIPNPFNLPVVHHKDEIKTNCRIDNLEWVSEAENISNWFDRRRIVVSVDMIKTITDAHDAGYTAAEILNLLPKRKKGER